jgi:hypothetical protein
MNNNSDTIAHLVTSATELAVSSQFGGNCYNYVSNAVSYSVAYLSLSTLVWRHTPLHGSAFRRLDPFQDQITEFNESTTPLIL